MPFYFIINYQKADIKISAFKNLYLILRNHLQDSSHFEYLG